MTHEEQLIRAGLAEGGVEWPGSGNAPSAESIIRTCARHGVSLLLYLHLKPTPAWNSWPVELRRIFERHARDETTREVLRARELMNVLDALAAAEIRPLLMKGTALAYSLYPQPASRARHDTDFLIPRTDVETTARVLDQHGYQSNKSLNALARFNHQIEYQKTDRYGIEHKFDVHWKISNTELFALAWSFSELQSRATCVPALGPHAQALGPLDAMLLACAHRIHHACESDADDDSGFPDDRLIWLYDIHLLAQSLTPEQWRQLTDLAITKGLQHICLDGLALTQVHLPTTVPGTVLQTLAANATGNAIEPEELSGGELRRLTATLKKTRNWRQRLSLAAAYAFPPPAYVLEKYESERRWLLPFLYVRRIIEGVSGRLR